MWQTMEAPDWAKLNVPPIDYQDAYYYAAPKAKPKLGSLDEVDPEILRVYEKLGIPIAEQEVLAGVEGARWLAPRCRGRCGVSTAFRSPPPSAPNSNARALSSARISEAIREYPDLVRRNGSARSCRCTTIISPHSTARSFPTGRSFTSPKACAARWSCLPISASTPKTPASSNAR